MSDTDSFSLRKTVIATPVGEGQLRILNACPSPNHKNYSGERDTGTDRISIESDKASLAAPGEQLTGNPPTSVRKYSASMRRIAVKTDGKLIMLDPSDICAVTAAGNYVEIHTEKKTLLVRESLSGMEQALSDAGFIRIHRSAIVQADKISEMHPWPGGEYQVVMSDGRKLTMSKSYRSILRLWLPEEEK